MRRLIASMFVSLDGFAQAPGAGGGVTGTCVPQGDIRPGPFAGAQPGGKELAGRGKLASGRP